MEKRNKRLLVTLALMFLCLTITTNCSTSVLENTETNSFVPNNLKHKSIQETHFYKWEIWSSSHTNNHLSYFHFNQNNTLEDVQNFVNTYITYVRENPSIDNWSTVPEIVETARGDCEEYVLLKYYLLKNQLGYKEDRLQFALVKDFNPPVDYHAVLLVDNKYVLDNRFENVLTVDDSRLKTYKVYYLINDKGVWF